MMRANTQDVITELRWSPFHPFAHYTQQLGRGRVAAHGMATLNALNHDSHVHVIATESGPNRGFAAWRRAPWETHHLGLSVARLDAFLCTDPHDRVGLAQLLSLLRNEWQSEHIDYVFTRVNAADIAATHVLEQGGFITLDNLVMLSIKTDGPGEGRSDPPVEVELTPATASDVPELRRIASTAFSEAHF